MRFALMHLQLHLHLQLYTHAIENTHRHTCNHARPSAHAHTHAGLGSVLLNTSAISAGTDPRLAPLAARGYAWKLEAPRVGVVMGAAGSLRSDAIRTPVRVPQDEVR